MLLSLGHFGEMSAMEMQKPAFQKLDVEVTHTHIGIVSHYVDFPQCAVSAGCLSDRALADVVYC